MANSENNSNYLSAIIQQNSMNNLVQKIKTATAPKAIAVFILIQFHHSSHSYHPERLLALKIRIPVVSQLPACYDCHYGK